MLACDETITIIRGDGTSYTTEVVEGVSWYFKSQATSTDKGLTGTRSISIRIPADRIPTMFPKCGDLVCKGTIDAVTSLSDLSGKEYAKVLTVSDNRRGGIPHVGLNCT